MAPRRPDINFRRVIFMLNSVIYGWGLSHKMALKWMFQDHTPDKSFCSGGAIIHLAFTWASVDPDLCHHMASLGHYEFSKDYNEYPLLVTHPHTYLYIKLIPESKNMVHYFAALFKYSTEQFYPNPSEICGNKSHELTNNNHYKSYLSCLHVIWDILDGQGCCYIMLPWASIH